MKPDELIKALRTLRDEARKLSNRRGDKWISEISFWGTAQNGIDHLLRDLREQKKGIEE